MTPLNAAVVVADTPSNGNIGIKTGQPMLATKIANPTFTCHVAGCASLMIASDPLWLWIPAAVLRVEMP
jgi:hypothetical protein